MSKNPKFAQKQNKKIHKENKKIDERIAKNAERIAENNARVAICEERIAKNKEQIAKNKEFITKSKEIIKECDREDSRLKSFETIDLPLLMKLKGQKVFTSEEVLEISALEAQAQELSSFGHGVLNRYADYTNDYSDFVEATTLLVKTSNSLMSRIKKLTLKSASSFSDQKVAEYRTERKKVEAELDKINAEVDERESEANNRAQIKDELYQQVCKFYADDKAMEARIREWIAIGKQRQGGV